MRVVHNEPEAPSVMQDGELLHPDQEHTGEPQHYGKRTCSQGTEAPNYEEHTLVICFRRQLPSITDR